MKVARVAVYTHKQLIVKRRSDLEDETVQTIWMELGLPQQKKILLMAGYRQWRLPGRGPETISVQEQRNRWTTILNQWEKALKEEKEVILMMDANLDSLTWNMDSSQLSPYHSSVKLRSLAEDLFARIFPHGVSLMVGEPTRAENGVEISCLDHAYTNKPEKLAPVQTLWTGMSDHKLLKIKRHSKSIQNKVRFTRKRTFKNFNKEEFKRRVRNMAELKLIEETSNVDEAAKLLTEGITRILDEMAPVKTIQVREKYAPHLSEETKELQNQRNKAQARAAESGLPEDWRIYRSLRNRCLNNLRKDRRNWEREKLNSTKNSSSDIWQTVKGILNWNSTGPPNQLMHEGKVISSPAGLASTMNNFFLEKVKKLIKKIPKTVCDPLKKLKDTMRNHECTFRLREITLEEGIKLIKDIKNSTATGVDFIDNSTIKLIANEIAPAITKIINPVSYTHLTLPTKRIV